MPFIPTPLPRSEYVLTCFLLSIRAGFEDDLILCIELGGALLSELTCEDCFATGQFDVTYCYCCCW